MNSKELDSQVNIQAKEEFIKLLPLVPIFLTVLGTIDLVFYYSHYKINIAFYVELSEFLILSLGRTATYSFSFILLVPIVISSKTFFASSLKIHRNPSIKWYLFLIIVASTLVYYLNIIFINYQVDTFYSVLFATINGIIFIVTYVMIMKTVIYINDHFSPPVSTVYKIYIVYFLSITGFTCFVNVIEYANILDNKVIKKNYGSFLKLENETIKLDSNNYLIGITKGYYFIHITKENSNRILPSSEIKESKFKINL